MTIQYITIMAIYLEQIVCGYVWPVCVWPIYARAVVCVPHVCGVCV